MDRIVILVDTLPKGAFCYAKQLGSRGRAPSLGLILVQLHINIKYRGFLGYNMGENEHTMMIIAQELRHIRDILADLYNLMDRRTY